LSYADENLIHEHVMSWNGTGQNHSY